MIQDSKLLFADNEALTSANATPQTCTNIIDLGEQSGSAPYTYRDAFGNALRPGIGKDITLFVNINVAMATASKIMTCTLVTGSSVSSSEISSSIDIASIVFPSASPAGTKKAVNIDYGALGRYVAVEYIATATLATVTIESGLIAGYNDSSIGAKFTA